MSEALAPGCQYEKGMARRAPFHFRRGTDSFRFFFAGGALETSFVLTTSGTSAAGMLCKETGISTKGCEKMSIDIGGRDGGRRGGGWYAVLTFDTSGKTI